MFLEGLSSKQSTVSLRWGSSRLCLATSLGFLLQDALLFPQRVIFAAMVNVLLGGVHGAIMHDPGGFVPTSLAVLAAIIVAVHPMQHQSDELLLSHGAWDGVPGGQFPPGERRDPGHRESGVSTHITHHSPAQCSGLYQRCFSRCS